LKTIGGFGSPYGGYGGYGGYPGGFGGGFSGSSANGKEITPFNLKSSFLIFRVFTAAASSQSFGGGFGGPFGGFSGSAANAQAGSSSFGFGK
jgi:molecular chaperone DnaJ